jgi:antitoxin FitA
VIALARGSDQTDCNDFRTRCLVASITNRNPVETVKRKLRLQAAQRNRSMEDEARDTLRTALAQEPAQVGSLADAIRRRVEPLGSVELSLSARGPMREPPDFT